MPPERRERVPADDWAQIPAFGDGAEAPDGLPNRRDKPTKRWDYLDEMGRLLFCVFRYDTSKGKTIRPLTYWARTGEEPASEWRVKGWQKKPVPLYGLDRLTARPDAAVLLVEGEKAADAASRLVFDMVGVTWYGGAENAQNADFSPLKGRTVYLWADNDEAGRKAADTIIPLLEADTSLFLVAIPEEMPEKGDIADLEGLGWTVEQVANWVTGNSIRHQKGETTKAKSGLVAVECKDLLNMTFPPRERLLSPWLPTQGLAMVYAMRGVGKTFFALEVAYTVASGGEFLGWKAEKPAGVLYIDGEMPVNVMQERLRNIAASRKETLQKPLCVLNQDIQDISTPMPRIDDMDGQNAIKGLLDDD